MSSNFQWVQPKHRLPPEHTEVLVQAKHWRGIFDVFYSDGKWWRNSDKEAEFFDEVWSWAEFSGECECKRSELERLAKLVRDTLGAEQLVVRWNDDPGVLECSVMIKGRGTAPLGWGSVDRAIAHLGRRQTPTEEQVRDHLQKLLNLIPHDDGREMLLNRETLRDTVDVTLRYLDSWQAVQDLDRPG